MDKFDIIKSYLLDEGFAETEEAAIGMMVSMSESWKEEILEGYKGKHGQSDKEYADSRSQGGKMISGDSKMSGAEYTHGRRVKATNPGMQPDVGGKTKPKSQGKMDKGTRADLEYRKANLKKEEIEVEEGYKEISFDKHQRMYDRYKKLTKAAIGDARNSGEASGDARRKMGKMLPVITKSSENLMKNQTKGELTGRGPRKEEVELDENRRAARSAGGYKDDSKKQTDPSKDGFTGISDSIEEIKRQNKEIEAKNKKMKKEEVEVEEGYKEIDQAKKNRMFRRAGNLSRDAISTPIPPEKRQEAHKKSGKIIKQLNKLNQEEVVLEKKKDDTYLETDMKKRQANNEKARKEMEKIPGQKNPHFEEVQQVDEALPLLAAVPALLAKGAAVAGKVGAVAAKGAAAAGKAGATAAKAGAKTSGLGMKGKLKLKMKDMAKDAIKSKAQDMASGAKDKVMNAPQSVADNNPLNSLKNSHEPQGEQIHEISAETALAASKGRDRQAMMLKGPEHTEKRAELRAKASQNYDRAVKKRKAGYVKNTASPQGPARKMTAESMSDIAALRAEMLKEEKE